MERNTALSNHLAGEAAEWFARLQSDASNDTVRDSFVQWLLRSPEHLEEFLAVSRIWGESANTSASRLSVDALVQAALAERETENVVALRGRVNESHAVEPRAAKYRKTRFFHVAAAAIGVVSVGVLGWLAVNHGQHPSHIQTAIGEQHSLTLTDGSIVDLNTDSDIRIEMGRGERQVHLLRGEARFDVAKDPNRPFIVSTPQARIRALGTIFNVRTEPDRTAVAVLDGRVEVRDVIEPQQGTGPGARLVLQAGDRAAVDRAGSIEPDSGPPLERVRAWTDRRLVFREAPLAEVVAEFNRYHRRPIRIEDPGLAGLRISGTFDSGDAHSLIEYFERFENVKVEHDSGGIRLSRPAQ